MIETKEEYFPDLAEQYYEVCSAFGLIDPQKPRQLWAIRAISSVGGRVENTPDSLLQDEHRIREGLELARRLNLPEARIRVLLALSLKHHKMMECLGRLPFSSSFVEEAEKFIGGQNGKGF